MTLNTHISLHATEIQRLEKTEVYQHLIISWKCTRVCDEAALQYHWIHGLKAHMGLKVIFWFILTIFMYAYNEVSAITMNTLLCDE